MNAADLAIVRRYFGPGFPITEIKYDANQNAEYIGIAPRGCATSGPHWIVERLTYDTNQNVTKTRVSPDNSIMDNYLTLDYQ